MPEANRPILDPIIAEARARWNRCDEAESAQRASILAAKKFRAGDQWPDDVKLQRQGAASQQGQAAQPPKPLVSIDRISQPVRQTSNQIKQANFGIDVLPNGHGADDDTAQIFKGYIRRVQNLARGESPVEWAADQAIEGGIGWFRLKTVYVRDDWQPGQAADRSYFDQELRLERITNNLTVYCDPSAKNPTRKDAQFMFITEDLSRDEFRRRWAKAREVGVEDLAGTGNFKAWADLDQIRIAEYWRIVYSHQQAHLLRDGRVLVGVKDLPEKEAVLQSRTIAVPTVECYKISGVEVLEQTTWLGSHIPLIPVLGEELNVDGTVVYRGMIQSAMDPQRMVNYHYSGAIMAVANATLAPWLVAEGQTEGYEAYWQNANRYNYACLPWKPTTLAGTLVPPPQRNTMTSGIAEIVQLLMISEDAIKATMAFWDPSLGKSSGSQESGKKVLALQKQSEVANSNFADNVMRALTYAGEMIVEVAPKLTRPGQLLHILGIDDTPNAVLAGQQFVGKAPGQDPQPIAPPGVKPGQPIPPGVFGFDAQMLQQGEPEFYDLTAGQYAVTVTIGQNETTMRNEGIAAVSDLIPHLLPEQQAIVTPAIVEEMSFPGAQKIAEILRKALPPQLQQTGDQGGPDPQLMAAQQQIQQLQQALQSKVAEKQAEAQAKGQIALQQTQLEQQGALQRTEITASASMANAQAKVDAENFRSYVDAFETKLSKALDLHFQATHQQMQQLHEHVQNALDRQHEARMAQLTHQQALEQGQQAAALAPEPAAANEAGA